MTKSESENMGCLLWMGVILITIGGCFLWGPQRLLVLGVMLIVGALL